MIHSILCQCRHRASGVDWDLNSLKDIDSTVHQDLVQSPLILLNSCNSSETQRNFYFINNKYSNRQSAQPYSVSNALLSSFVLFFEQFSPPLFTVYCVRFHLVLRWVNSRTQSVTQVQESAVAFYWFPLSIHSIHPGELKRWTRSLSRNGHRGWKDTSDSCNYSWPKMTSCSM